ncbi:hypothetical protein ABNQ39_00225 (plasmid) [Azospirillum sp. A26]|uniref:hypothetical protein n=1 Tax=Azospirillum sp. A26 TaxID=3160607 RepID=UPI003672F2FA
MSLTIPRLPPNPTPADLERWAGSLARSLATQLDPLLQAATGRDGSGAAQPYQVSDYTARRSLTMASTPSTTDLGNVVSTVIADLKAKGILA